MRHLLFSAVIVGAGWVALAPAMATTLSLPGLNGPKVTTAIEKIGYWKRQYRRYGYPSPYVDYPPAYGYYPPPAAYVYPPPVYGYQPPPPCLFSVRAWQSGPSAGRQLPSAEGDYGDYPPAEGDYPPAGGEEGDYPPDGSSHP